MVKGRSGIYYYIIQIVLFFFNKFIPELHRQANILQNIIPSLLILVAYAGTISESLLKYKNGEISRDNFLYD